MLVGLLSRGGGIDISTWIRNDNSSVVEHVRSINSVTKERALHGLLESNRAALGEKPLLALSIITGPLNISDGMAKTMARNKLILLPRNISKEVSWKGIW